MEASKAATASLGRADLAHDLADPELRLRQLPAQLGIAAPLPEELAVISQRRLQELAAQSGGCRPSPAP